MIPTNTLHLRPLSALRFMSFLCGCYITESFALLWSYDFLQPSRPWMRVSRMSKAVPRHVVPG